MSVQAKGSPKNTIDHHILLAISNVAKQFIPIQKIILFGSRARGDHDERSDIDLAVFAQKPFEDFFDFQYKIENVVPTLLKFDIVLIEPNTDKALLHEISKDGVLLYEKCNV